MSRIIRIDTCAICPSRDHKGAFGPIGYVPICRAVNKELPYTASNAGCNGTRLMASATNEIPEWCPLDRDHSGELLEALKVWVELYSEPRYECCPEVIQSRAAIAKATGE